jgi:hypothetical protein
VKTTITYRLLQAMIAAGLYCDPDRNRQSFLLNSRKARNLNRLPVTQARSDECRMMGLIATRPRAEKVDHRDLLLLGTPKPAVISPLGSVPMMYNRRHHHRHRSGDGRRADLHTRPERPFAGTWSCSKGVPFAGA